MTDAIHATGLVKTYGSVTALDGLDLRVPEGMVLGLLGPNGAGKTTCVRILATLLRPDAGHATVAGVDVLAHPDRVRRIIGLSGQHAAVDEYLTGYENLEMVGRLYQLGKARARQRARELLERFELSDAADRPVKTYSGGMRRRLDLAGALVTSPPVIFLDEPTTGLDPRSRLGLWEIISERARGGATVLLTTQYLEEADRLADEVIVIDHGQAIAQGTPESLKRKIGGERIQLTLEDARDLEAARGILAAIGQEPPVVDASAGTVGVAVAAGPAALMETVRRLDAAGVRPRDIDIHRATLDDVFLTLTGRPAADKTDAERLDEPPRQAPDERSRRRGRREQEVAR